MSIQVLFFNVESTLSWRNSVKVLCKCDSNNSNDNTTPKLNLWNHGVKMQGKVTSELVCGETDKMVSL